MSKTWLNRAFIYRAVKKPDGDAVICVKDGTVTHAAISPKFSAVGTSIRSPITTLLHHLSIEQATGAELYSTAVPSEMCRGMARLFGVRKIFYKRTGNSWAELSTQLQHYFNAFSGFLDRVRGALT